jgi:hypothetical protein
MSPAIIIFQPLSLPYSPLGLELVTSRMILPGCRCRSLDLLWLNMRQQSKQRQLTVGRADHWHRSLLVPDDIATRVTAASRTRRAPLSLSLSLSTGTAANRAFVIESFGTFDSARHSHKKPPLGYLFVFAREEEPVPRVQMHAIARSLCQIVHRP